MSASLAAIGFALLIATFARTPALAGNLALVSQSGAIATSILDWAHGARIGFTSVVSLGGVAAMLARMPQGGVPPGLLVPTSFRTLKRLDPRCPGAAWR